MQNELRSTLELMRDPSGESIASSRHLTGIAGYLVLSAACGAPLAMSGVALSTRIALAVILLAGFLVIARYTVARVRELGEFEQLIAYRALATAGFIAVWFVLFTGVVFLLVGFDNLFLVMALGPPEFWLCAALFMRGAEKAYARNEA